MSGHILGWDWASMARFRKGGGGCIRRAQASPWCDCACPLGSGMYWWQPNMSSRVRESIEGVWDVAPFFSCGHAFVCARCPWRPLATKWGSCHQRGCGWVAPLWSWVRRTSPDSWPMLLHTCPALGLFPTHGGTEVWQAALRPGGMPLGSGRIRDAHGP